ncbi:hypothetical protein ABIA39_004679 [Nocardia sp. GAS34]
MTCPALDKGLIAYETAGLCGHNVESRRNLLR